MIIRRRVLCIPVDFEFPDGELTERLDVDALADNLARHVGRMLLRDSPRTYEIASATAHVNEGAIQVQR